MCTLGNYEYGFFWYFYMDGTMQMEVKLTGLVNTNPVPPGETNSVYGTILGSGLEAQNHQHFFCARLDMNIDGPLNSIVEMHSRAQDDDKNPFGNAFISVEKQLKTEIEAQRCIDPLSDRHWKIINPKHKNKMGKPVGWKLIPGGNTLPYAKDWSWLLIRAPFLRKHLWVTRYDPSERYPSGEYPNQSRGEDNIAVWTRKNRSIDTQDIVVWYMLGATHIVQLEDYPIMNVEYLSFKLKPSGFFGENPTIDIPPPKKCCL